MGQEALLRFYVLHVAVLPIVMVLLIVIHFWRIRKDGGLSRPPEADEAGTPVSVTVRAVEVAKNKIYGLQGFVRGPFTKGGQPSG